MSSPKQEQLIDGWQDVLQFSDAVKAAAEEAVKEAVKRGMSQIDAELIYGYTGKIALLPATGDIPNTAT